MLMKLARFDNEKIKPDIIACCTQNKADYVPIIKNRFGILTDDYEIAFSNDGTDEHGINLKVFVNIYQCVSNIVNAKKQKFLFWEHKLNAPYKGKILDNRFFKQIITFCSKQNDIFIEYIQIMSEFNTRDIIRDLDEIQEITNRKSDFFIEKMNVNLKNKSIIFDRVGYVDIPAGLNFYENNKDIIISMLRVGFEE